MINSVRHTGVVVRDLEKSAIFYRSLGFIDFKHALEQGKFIDQVTGLNNTKLEWIKLKAPDGYLLELLKYHSDSDSIEVVNQNSNKLGCSHMAFGVDDIKKTCQLIKKNGGSILNPPALSDDKKAIVAYCHDNEGVLMEIVEIL
jgi:catechol 2,3-dioxygenase-like lactoylglutathione lyase family enzyme